MTDEMYEKVIKAIDECEWRKDMCGINICSAEVVPCENVIDAGDCQIIKRVLRGDAE